MDSEHFYLPGTTMNVSLLLKLQHLAAVGIIEYLSAAPGNKKPPRDDVAGGGI